MTPAELQTLNAILVVAALTLAIAGSIAACLLWRVTGPRSPLRITITVRRTVTLTPGVHVWEDGKGFIDHRPLTDAEEAAR